VGTAFDLIDGRIDTTLEGGHSRSRIIHAHGDETGRAIAEALIAKVRSTPNIRVIEGFFTIDLLTDQDNRCVGVVGACGQQGPQIIWAANAILASGGVGQLYRETTNPAGATADGLAMAYRAGAVLRDMEFMQFHPTTLYIAGASRALITETLRGEGAVLLDTKGRRFMKEYHEARRAGAARRREPGHPRPDAQNRIDPRLSRRASPRQRAIRQAVSPDQRSV